MENKKEKQFWEDNFDMKFPELYEYHQAERNESYDSYTSVEENVKVFIKNVLAIQKQMITEGLEEMIGEPTQISEVKTYNTAIKDALFRINLIK